MNSNLKQIRLDYYTKRVQGVQVKMKSDGGEGLEGESKFLIRQGTVANRRKV